MNITFITGNESKAKELSRHLHHPVKRVALDLEEIQSLDVREVVEEKAKEAYRQVGETVLVEDVSVVFHALGKLPGPLIKWFLQELDLEGLCELLNNYDDRTATAEVCFGLYDGEKLELFEGVRHGSIATEPKGSREFGWNPIFVPEGATKTWAEMSVDEQKETSMRRLALEKLATYIENK